MKKKIWIPILAVVFLAILTVPIPTGVCKDGGTRIYSALSYKIVDWNRLVDAGDTYDNTKVYFFPNNFKSVDQLWQLEEPKVAHRFTATIIEINGTSVTVVPTESSVLAWSYDKIVFDSNDLEKLDIKPGDTVDIQYKGEVMESYPAQINAIGWNRVSP